MNWYPFIDFSVKVNFMFATEEARKTINAWISANTSGKIEELFAPGVLDQTTLMVLANAIYFKGKWYFFLG